MASAEPAGLQQLLTRRGDAAALLTSPWAIARHCGFRYTQVDRVVALFVPADGRPQLIVPEYEESAAQLASGDVADVVAWPDGDGPRRQLGEALATLPRGASLALELGVLAASAVDGVHALRPDVLISNCTPDLDARMAVKTAAELAMIEKASVVADRTVDRLVRDHLRPGATEADLSAELTRLLRVEGGDWTAGPPNVTSGPRSAFPHGPELSGAHGAAIARPTVEEGEPVILDFSVVVGGFIADISRTYVLGTPSQEIAELYEVVEEARRLAIAAMTPGVTGHEVDRVARDVIDAAGYGDRFPQRTGHGVGLRIHEMPDLAVGSADVLEVGMVACVEPAVYLPGVAGLRTEDVVVVEDTGTRVLTHCSRELVIAT
jgi:Xaa-Pro aminopeptidase